MNKLILSRNKREGYYAGYYPYHIIFGEGGHRRWPRWAMSELYPRIRGVTWVEKMWDEMASENHVSESVNMLDKPPQAIYITYTAAH